MRKVFHFAAAITVVGLMHGAFACESSRDASQSASAILLPGACSGSDCLVDPQQNPPTPLIDQRQTLADPVQDCGAAYFDPGTYSGSTGLLDWLVASLDAQGQYKLGAGFAPSPMDANAQYR
jgi:hypothetical protein